MRQGDHANALGRLSRERLEQVAGPVSAAVVDEQEPDPGIAFEGPPERADVEPRRLVEARDDDLHIGISLHDA